MRSYIGFPELRASLGITAADPSDYDGGLALAAEAAAQAIDNQCRRTFTLDDEASARVFDATDSQFLIVDDIGDASVTVALSGGGSPTWSTLPRNALAKGEPITQLRCVTGWGGYDAYTDATVTVTARWGWPEVPADIQQACLIQATRFYNRKDSPQGAMGFADVIGGAIRIPKLDPDVAITVQMYMRPKL